MTGQLLALEFKYLFSIYFTTRRLGIPFTEENENFLHSKPFLTSGFIIFSHKLRQMPKIFV